MTPLQGQFLSLNSFLILCEIQMFEGNIKIIFKSSLKIIYFINFIIYDGSFHRVPAPISCHIPVLP